MQTMIEQALAQVTARAEAAEARVAELELEAAEFDERDARIAVLRGALAHLLEFADMTGQGCSKQVEDARQALAAPDERAQALLAVATWAEKLETEFDGFDDVVKKITEPDPTNPDGPDKHIAKLSRLRWHSTRAGLTGVRMPFGAWALLRARINHVCEALAAYKEAKNG
ncbi:MAG: hypothetical protein GY906_24135 [bacterium]|nr:hypothetical protein [bacterium]